MRFIGKVWRLLVGVKDALVLLFMLLFFGALYAALSANPYAGSASEGALLLALSGSIVEQPAESEPFELLAGGGPLVREYRLRDVVHALETAATDDRVKAVALDLDIFTGGGQSALSDVGAAMDVVRKAGKPVVAYATGYSDDSYLLAAHASEVWLDPLGGVLIAGPGGANLYYKGLLDKIGVTANVYRVGTYKAAVEPFTRSDMSPESREASQALAGALWETWQDEVQRSRPKAQLAAYVAAPAQLMAAAGGDMAKAALAAGLVDRIGDRTAFGKRMAELAGVDEEKVPGSFKTIAYDAWINANPAVDNAGQIGVVTVAGEIVDGEAGLGTAGGETVAKAIYKGLEKRDLRALVVRVDSPGGSVLASERIRQAVLDAKSKGLPVVVSMGSVAASGGYWIATAGDRIFAEPETITGSIGVFGILPSFEGTLDKLGVGADGVKTTPLSGEPDILRGPSPEADQLIQLGVEGTYRRFVGLVAAARKMPAQRVDQIAQGRVWDGGTARQLGLVDQFGSLDAAIAEAARRAKLDPETAKAVWLEKEPSWFDALFASAAGSGTEEQARDVFSRVAAKPERMLLRGLHDARRILSGPAIQARCLDCPSGTTPLRRRDRQSLGAWLTQLLPG
ncbi:signal peptide peptidase SppA [Sphingosinicella sp. LY1275]|uniref:signal peptide peptidase SppA n=1 Tax=Sphingosinicella sp. LY1275 TaxID=3095379 RepID=UPI002ADEF7DD|nr:signal peptide peptidase SppA [Sphingosinicella sp. LY1275]MEA1014390.1 signal peptide peptidase SppA [Sphingosinicella sp. LY1275]